MLTTVIKYQHVIQLDETKSGVEVYARQVSAYLSSDSDITPLFRINEKEGKYEIALLSDKVVILPKQP